MILKIYSPPIINVNTTDQATRKSAPENSLYRSISFTENSSNDIKTKAKEISIKYDLLVDDVLCNTPGVQKNQRERLRNIGFAVTALEQVTKKISPVTEKNPTLGFAFTEKIKNICEALPVDRKRNFTHDDAYLLRGSNFISEFLASQETSVDKISYAQLLHLGEKMRKNSTNPTAINDTSMNKFLTVWELRNELAQY